MTNLGTAAEHRVRLDLSQRHGWTFWARPGASKGPADLILAKPGLVALVQVKRTNPVLPPAERQALIQMADSIGLKYALPIVATTPFRKRPAYRLLTGPGAKDWTEWDPSEPAWRSVKILQGPYVDYTV